MPSRASTRSLKEMTWIPLVWSETYDETTSSVSLKFAFVLLSFPLHSVCDAGCHFYLFFFGYILKPYVRVEVIVVNRHFVVFSNGDRYKLISDHVCWIAGKLVEQSDWGSLFVIMQRSLLSYCEERDIELLKVHNSSAP